MVDRPNDSESNCAVIPRQSPFEEDRKEDVWDDAACNQPIERSIRIHVRIVGWMHFHLARSENITCQHRVPSDRTPDPAFGIALRAY